MILLNDEEIKRIELELLKKFKKICEENNIVYYLADGTLLGAIRHKGFIPWDDDIDVHVNRKDYDKLIKILNEVSDAYNLSIICKENNPKCERAFLKICDSRTKLEYNGKSSIKDLGVFIDVFPLDNQGNSFKDGIKLEKKIKKYSFMRNVCVMREFDLKKFKNWIKLLCYPIARLFGIKFWVKKMDTLFKTWNDEETLFYGSNQPTSIILKKEVFSDVVSVEFEGEMFFAPIGYDDYLRYHYGNYMELPPVEKRIQKHNFRAYYIENKEGKYEDRNN